MTKFEFIRQNPLMTKEKLLRQFGQKFKAPLIEEGKLNPHLESKLHKYLIDPEIKKTKITKSEIIIFALNLIKEENGGILPNNLQKLENQYQEKAA